MKINTTIIVSPRERYSSILASLQSLFQTIPAEIPVVVIECCSPPKIREKLKELQTVRSFDCLFHDHFITPQEARNIGMQHVNTEFVVFTDNDIFYEKDWLELMEKNAISNGSDLVAPLICIGPPLAKKIHHAGGTLDIRGGLDLPYVREIHRLGEKPIETLEKCNLSIDIEIVEFHCFLARCDYIRKVGPMDERLISREHIDFGLRAAINNARVTFEQNSVVTYAAYTKMNPVDLSYFIFRWSDPLALKSINTFRNTWKIHTNAQQVMNQWIRPHRFKAVMSAYPEKLKALGKKNFIEQFYLPLNRQITEKALATRKNTTEPAFPADPDPAKRQQLFSNRMQDQNAAPVLPIQG